MSKILSIIQSENRDQAKEEWLDRAEKRLEEVKNGDVETISSEDVMDTARSEIE